MRASSPRITRASSIGSSSGPTIASGGGRARGTGADRGRDRGRRRGGHPPRRTRGERARGRGANGAARGREGRGGGRRREGRGTPRASTVPTARWEWGGGASFRRGGPLPSKGTTALFTVRTTHGASSKYPRALDARAVFRVPGTRPCAPPRRSASRSSRRSRSPRARGAHSRRLRVSRVGVPRVVSPRLCPVRPGADVHVRVPPRRRRGRRQRLRVRHRGRGVRGGVVGGDASCDPTGCSRESVSLTFQSEDLGTTWNPRAPRARSSTWPRDALPGTPAARRAPARVTAKLGAATPSSRARTSGRPSWWTSTPRSRGRRPPPPPAYPAASPPPSPPPAARAPPAPAAWAEGGVARRALRDAATVCAALVVLYAVLGFAFVRAKTSGRLRAGAATWPRGAHAVAVRRGALPSEGAGGGAGGPGGRGASASCCGAGACRRTGGTARRT